jgi:tetratricopeptide (TPR) repeat protein
LAFQHAGELPDAIAMLRRTNATGLVADLHAVRSVVELCAAIDAEDWAACRSISDRLESELASCAPEARRRVEGMVRGTQGRAALHLRDDANAIALLRESVAWHERSMPREVARSRIHLAAALRQAGQPDDALDQLGLAARGLGDAMRFSRPYGLATQVFLHYERARVFAALGRFAEARDEANEASALARPLGFWPELGILRVLAWCEAALGEPSAHEAAVEQMRQLVVPPAHESLRQRLIALAIAGPSVDDDETY